MTTSNLLRASGSAAIVAGVLGASASFVPDSVTYAERQILYGLLLAWTASTPRDELQHDTDEGSGVLAALRFTIQMGNTTDTL